jgi:hypothetical protein
MQSKLPMHLSRRCRARTRGSGNPCQSPAMTNGRRMHGGKSGSPEGIKTHLSTGDIPLLRLPPADCADFQAHGATLSGSSASNIRGFLSRLSQVSWGLP